MLYYAVLDLGMNDFLPMNNVEYLYLIVTLIISAFLNSLIFGDVAGLIAVLQKKEVLR